jgi:hypothetical protein
VNAALRLALFAHLLLFTACSAVPSRPDPPALARPVPVSVIVRAWHTEVGLRAEDLTGPLAALRARFPGAAMLVFSFGDRRYLAAPDPGFGDTLLAALPAPGALLVTGIATTPEAAFGGPNVVRLMLSEGGARRAAAYVSGSFAHDATGALVALGDGPYPGSLFYAASIPYALTHTCNTWTAEVLAAGGAAVSADGVLFAGQVTARARAAQVAAMGPAPPR